MQMTIQEIRSDQADAYTHFFQKGLREDEGSFRISPNDPADFPTEDSAESFTLGAYIGSDLAGVVSFTRDGKDREKIRHKGWMIRMLVAREHRGKGIARALVENLVQRARALEGLEQINLTVISPIAKPLYEKLGFEVFAKEERALKYKGTYITEYQMALRLG